MGSAGNQQGGRRGHRGGECLTRQTSKIRRVFIGRHHRKQIGRRKFAQPAPCRNILVATPRLPFQRGQGADQRMQALRPVLARRRHPYADAFRRQPADPATAHRHRRHALLTCPAHRFNRSVGVQIAPLVSPASAPSSTRTSDSAPETAVSPACQSSDGINPCSVRARA